MTPEIKQVQEATDAFKDNVINKIESDKIAEALDPVKIKSTDIQEFLKDSKSYPSFLDGLIANIEQYTDQTGSVNLHGTAIISNKDKVGETLDINYSSRPKVLTLDEINKIKDDAKNFLLRLKDEKRKLSNTTEKKANDITPPQEKEKANFDKKKNALPVTPPIKKEVDKEDDKNKKYEAKYIAGKPLESMKENLNTILPVDKQLPEADVMRKNMKENIMNKIEAILDKNLKNKGNRGELKEEMKNWFNNELTDNRISNLITGAMYVTIHNIDQKIKAPEAITVDNFSLVGVNLFKDIKDINSLLSVNGDWMKNILNGVENKVTTRIQESFTKGELLFASEEAFKKKLAGMSNTRGINESDPNSISFEATANNPITKLFKNDLILDTEKDVITLIQGNTSFKNAIDEKDIATPQKIQENLYNKANAIMSSIPLDPHEKEAFKTGLMQNKISGWPKNIVESFFKLLQGTELLKRFKGLFGNTLDKLFLSKARNDAQEGAKTYEENKKNYILSQSDIDFTASITNEQYKSIIGNISSEGVYNTLVLSKKYILPENTTSKEHQDKFLSNGEYDINKVGKEFAFYKNHINTNWDKVINKKMVDAKGKDTKEGGTEIEYKYADIIKSEKDLLEHFFQYVQTGEKPENYKDKEYYEALNAPWKKVTVTTDGKAPDGNVVVKEIPPIAPLANEKVPTNKPREKAANDFATSVKGNAFESKLWTDAYAVEFTVNGKKVIRMFKSPTSKRISKK